MPTNNSSSGGKIQRHGRTIRAEVINWEDLVNIGSFARAREQGRVRVEGRDYQIQDGDVVLFRFNV